MCAPHTDAASIQNHNYVRLEFKGIGASGFLGCPQSVCDLRSCPYYSNYIKSLKPCDGEQFRIVVENGGTVHSGERVRFQYVIGGNEWLGCFHDYNYCKKYTCPGSLSQATNFNRCAGETFRIYARGRDRTNIVNGDLVMIHLPYNNKYISIPGYKERSNTYMNSCPEHTPPSYDDYTKCSNNVFRIYRN